MKVFLIVMLFSVNTLSALAGNDGFAENKRRFGVDIGYGFQHGLDVAYYHQVYFMQMKYFIDIGNKNKWSFDVALMPQFNLTRYKVSNNSSIHENGIEFGLQVGFVGRHAFENEKGNAFLILGVGPHYVSGVPARQIPGFIFSDNIIAGIEVKIGKHFSFALSGGFRHISNASLKQPNGGINNLMIFTGLIFQ
jgi:hypothetical protein